jgi:cold shock CspA family protein
MADAIDGKNGNRAASVIDGLFVPREAAYAEANGSTYERIENGNGTPGAYRKEERSHAVSDERMQGRVQNVKEGYGFIETSTPGRNLFFYWEDVDGDFHDLRIGDLVEYSTGYNHRGECAVEVTKITDPEAIANAQQTLCATIRFDD